MPPDHATKGPTPDIWPTLRRFLPYLWPEGRADLKLRIVGAAVFILLSKGVALSMGWLFGQAVDAMQPGQEAAFMVAIALVVAYATARFSGVLFDNLRNFVFERVGQEATRELAVGVFRHLHSLSLAFHLSRRTGEVTKVIERGIHVGHGEGLGDRRDLVACAEVEHGCHRGRGAERRAGNRFAAADQ